MGLPCNIEDYGIVGDCRAAALVSKRGSIDWLCWPRFDSPAVFAALLDSDNGGYWSISPSQSFQVKRNYIPDSNVLETHFVCATGRATLIDLMPVASEDFRRQTLLPDHELLRQLRCNEGEIQIQVEFRPRRHYGLHGMRMQDLGPLGLRTDTDGGALWLRGTLPLKIQPGGASASVSLKQGDSLQFSLTYAEEAPAVLPALGMAAEAAIQRSIRWWKLWTGRCSYQGPYREAVARSVLAVKLLTYPPSGAIAAAPTTSLPEVIGGGLNWDYRYCWLRDASLTIRALLGLGYFEEAESFFTWLLHATRLTHPQLRVLYTVFGRIVPREKELAHLGGYRESRPARIGNDARNQLQLDVYGEVIEAAARYANRTGGLDRTTQKSLIGLGKYVATNWNQADEGIWEPRSGRLHHTHSRLLCWTALDRLLALSEKRLLQGVPRSWFAQERESIRQQIESRAWNENLHSYVSVLDGDQIDASLLRIPWYGFEDAGSQRMKKTYQRIRQELGTEGSLLYRYRGQAAEGAFGVCGFWGVEHLALGGGTLQQAHNNFQQLLKYGNDLGLFAEEVEPSTGAALGNFPQVFTHVGLISAALTLEETERGESPPAIQTGTDAASSNKSVKT